MGKPTHKVRFRNLKHMVEEVEVEADEVEFTDSVATFYRNNVLIFSVSLNHFEIAINIDQGLIDATTKGN